MAMIPKSFSLRSFLLLVPFSAFVLVIWIQNQRMVKLEKQMDGSLLKDITEGRRSGTIPENWSWVVEYRPSSAFRKD